MGSASKVPGRYGGRETVALGPMCHPPVRRRYRAPLPIDVRVVPGGVEIDFGPVLNALELDELMRGLAIRWQSITGV